MRNISRGTTQGGSYRTVARFFNTVLPWPTLCGVFFRAHLYDPDDVYWLAGDETVVPKVGDTTYGLSRFFASTYGKTIRGLAFFAVSIIRIKSAFRTMVLSIRECQVCFLMSAVATGLT